MWTSSETTAGSRTSRAAGGPPPRHRPPAPSRLLLALLPLLIAFLAAAVHAVPAEAARSRPAKGVYHLVKRGETLSGIARAYGVTVETIREANRMTRKDRLEADRALFIPGAREAIEDTRPGAAKKAARPPREKTRSAGKRDGGKEPDKPKKKAAEAATSRPAPKPAPVARTARDAARKPGRPEASRERAPAPPKAPAPVRPEPLPPAGRINITDALVFFSEADREKAEKAAEEERARAALAQREPSAKPAAAPERPKAIPAPVREREHPAAAPEGKAKEPRAAEAPAARPEPPRKEASAPAAPAVRREPAGEIPDQGKRKRLLWPVKGRVLTRFGPQSNGMYSNGVRIAAREGTPVVAALQGTVIFSAPLKDYGETVILRHDDSYATVYTNLGSRLVNTDEKVRAGTRIGLVGRDERTAAGVLHFEVRVKNKACNPLLFLN